MPIRLRYVALLVGAGLSLRSLGLGALAFWQLHTAAAQLANYAACMAGPTGPQLIHRHPDQFAHLVRRRLVAAQPDVRPFASCLSTLDGVVGAARDARRAAHEARAGEYREYGGLRGDSQPHHLGELAVDVGRIDQLRSAAWPFAPADIEPLIVPERATKQAQYVPEPPRAARGRGLPAAELGYSTLRTRAGGQLLVAGRGANLRAFQSADGGINWTSLDEDAAEPGVGGECSAADGRTRFGLIHSGAQLRVESWVNGAPETSFPVAGGDSRLLSFACDAGAALAIVREEGARRPAFRVCPHLTPCRNMSVPPVLRDVASEGVELSIARVKGVAVISMARAGVVRVISSRDDGETWTPAIVAYDREEQDASRRATPSHLLTVGSRVLLYAGGRDASEQYPVLSSGDFGASWQGQ